MARTKPKTRITKELKRKLARIAKKYPKEFEKFTANGLQTVREAGQIKIRRVNPVGTKFARAAKNSACGKTHSIGKLTD